jgi:hypothetical protein
MIQDVAVIYEMAKATGESISEIPMEELSLTVTGIRDLDISAGWPARITWVDTSTVAAVLVRDDEVVGDLRAVWSKESKIWTYEVIVDSEDDIYLGNYSGAVEWLEKKAKN